MSMANILKDLELVEKASAGNTTEPFAAHELLPLVASLAQEVARVENGLIQVASAKPELQPQIAQLSVQLVTELRHFLREMAFEGVLYHLQEGEDEDEQNIKARGLFLALESQIERKPIEMVAEFWMQQMQAQAQQMIAEMEAAEDEADEYEEEENEVEQDEVEIIQFQEHPIGYQTPVEPSELPQPPPPSSPTVIQHAAPQPALEMSSTSPLTPLEGGSDDDQTG